MVSNIYLFVTIVEGSFFMFFMVCLGFYFVTNKETYGHVTNYSPIYGFDMYFARQVVSILRSIWFNSLCNRSVFGVGRRESIEHFRLFQTVLGVNTGAGWPFKFLFWEEIKNIPIACSLVKNWPKSGLRSLLFLSPIRQNRRRLPNTYINKTTIVWHTFLLLSHSIPIFTELVQI